MVSRLLFVLALGGWLVGCDGGEPILLDPAPADDDDDTGDDDTGDDDTGDDDTGDDDTAPGCEWDGEYIGLTTIDFYFWVAEGETTATVLDCEIDGVIRFDLEFEVFWVDLLGGIDPMGTAAGVIHGKFGKLGTIDEPWGGTAVGDNLSGEFLVDMGPAIGSFDLDRE